MIDLNTLVKASSTSLYLVFGNDINSRGEIASFAFDQSNGGFHAALTIPRDGEHADMGAVQVIPKPQLRRFMSNRGRQAAVSPNDLREQLRKRLGFSSGSGPVRQQ